MGLELDFKEGDTPLDDDEKEGLLITSISTKKELDEWEQKNIESAIQWIEQRRKKWTAQELLSEKMICTLHKKMFGTVWEWAGTFRNTEKNIGVPPYQIGIQLRQLLDDTNYWIANSTYSPGELTIRFKTRLVQIHCFPNGNGRHSRLMADIIIEKLLGEQRFNWGKTQENARAKYLTALRIADNTDNYQPLIRFAWS